MLCPIQDDEVCGTSRLDEAAIEAARPRCVARGEAERLLRRNIADAGEKRQQPQDPERLNAAAGGRVGAEYDALSLTQPDRGAHGVQRRQFIAVMNDLNRAP